MCCYGRAYGSGVPAVRDPGLADEATDGDDRVCEVEERVDYGLAAFVAALEPVEGVVPGVGALDVPATVRPGWAPSHPYPRSRRTAHGRRGYRWSCPSR